MNGLAVVPPPLHAEGQRRYGMSLFLSPSRHLRPSILPSSFLQSTHTSRVVCSICKIAEYGRKTQAACTPIWLAWTATISYRPPLLYVSANSGKIGILTLTLRRKYSSRLFAASPALWATSAGGQFCPLGGSERFNHPDEGMTGGGFGSSRRGTKFCSRVLPFFFHGCLGFYLRYYLNVV